MAFRPIPLFWVFFMFELGIGVVGYGLAYFFPTKLGFQFGVFEPKLALDTAVCLLPMLCFLGLATSQWGKQQPGLGRIYREVRDSILGDFILKAGWPALLFVSLAAGLGEELLFRGWLQGQLGLWGASIIFGLLHALSFSYFVVATVIGVYLGLLFEWTGNQLLVPMLVHGIYDFIALLMYRKSFRQDAQKEIRDGTDSVE